MFTLSIDEWKKLLTALNIKYIDTLGKNDRLKCFCPFHKDSKPSFYIYKKYYMCYGISCQESGDVFDLIKKLRFNNTETSFGELVDFLADYIDNDKLKNYQKYKHKQRKNLSIFKDWANTNEDINIEDYKFLLPIKKSIKEAKIVQNKNWNLIFKCINFFDYTDRIYKRDLVLIHIDRLGYYVFSKGGKLVSKISSNRDNYIFDIHNVGLNLSGNQISKMANKSEKTEFKVIQSTFYTENPIYYLNLKKYKYVSLGIVNVDSILNFKNNYVIFCFLIIDDGTTTLTKRFKELYNFHKNNNIKWFYKIIKVKEDNYVDRVKTFLEINS